MSHLLTAAPQPGPEQCGDLHGAFCKKSLRKILLLPSFLVFSELYFQRYSNMPCFPAVQIEYNLREELIPYEYPLKSSKGRSLHLNLIQGRACTQKMGDSRAGQSPWWSRGRLAVEGGRWGLASTVHPWGHVLFLGQHNLDCCFLLHCTASRHDSAAPPRDLVTPTSL